MITRRRFLEVTKKAGIAATLLPFVACERQSGVKGQIIGGYADRGHRIREMKFSQPTQTIKTGIVIVGGGASGLSAARYLKRYTNDFLLLELGQTTGGNAEGGCNNVSCYPWGAHYLPIPGNGDPELISFLRECKVITGEKNGLPVFNEYYLCHDPKERLFINNFWQEGIIPHEGLPAKDREEIQRFLEAMNHFKHLTGSDQRKAFALPVDDSSQDPTLLELDSITAAAYLKQHGFKSPYLEWYVNYCCADDYGTSVTQTSAWAMIHYFASRAGKAFDVSADTVLTWPEGNSWLTNRLAEQVKENIRVNCIVHQVSTERNGVICDYFDFVHNHSIRIVAERVIMATPQFVNQRILRNVSRSVDLTKFEYAPWMVANITTGHPLNERRGEQLAWDNVIYGSSSLGYVNANHQHVGIPSQNRVITYYKPLLSDDVALARRNAYQTSFDDWTTQLLSDLKVPHPDIDKHIDNIDIRLWGHGMIKPGKGFVWSDARLLAGKPIDGKVFFAHSDLSGISIFEEAFYRGHSAAKQVLAA